MSVWGIPDGSWQLFMRPFWTSAGVLWNGDFTVVLASTATYAVSYPRARAHTFMESFAASVENSEPSESSTQKASRPISRSVEGLKTESMSSTKRV
jgi:hypothetical protein